MTVISPVTAEEVDEVLDLIAAEQAHPSRGTTMLGEERDGHRGGARRTSGPTGYGQCPGGPRGRPHRRRRRGRLGRRGRPGLDPRAVGRWRRRGLAPMGPAAARRRPRPAPGGHRRLGAGGRRRARADGRSSATSSGWSPSEVSHVYSVDAATVERGRTRGWRGPAGDPRRPGDDPAAARPGVPGVVRDGRAPGARAARRQVPRRHRRGRAAIPRVRRRPGAA